MNIFTQNLQLMYPGLLTLVGAPLLEFCYSVLEFSADGKNEIFRESGHLDFDTMLFSVSF